jgi:uncharacterized protein (TIGR02594 family)
MKVSEIQRALKAQGFDPGPIDGIRGRATIAAIRAFQAHNGLEVDGIAGPQTLKKLFPGMAAPGSGGGVATAEIIPGTMPWMDEAVRNVGVTEDTGPGNNPLLIGWGDDLDIDYSADSIPWCGLFVAHCIGSQLPEEPLPTYPLLARDWRKFGEPCKPQLGAVMVFWRGQKSGPLGHVAFYTGEDDQAYHVVGGNQSDRVSVTRMGKDRFLEARWPSSAPDPTGIIRHLKANGELSRVEQ